MNTNGRFLYKSRYGMDEYGWQIKSYFVDMYRDGRLEIAVKRILEKEGYSVNTVQCRFPEENSYDDCDHFEGVEFEMGRFDDDSEIRVSEEECLAFVKEAISLYESRHPDRKGFADADLAKSTLGR